MNERVLYEYGSDHSVMVVSRVYDIRIPSSLAMKLPSVLNRLSDGDLAISLM